MKEEKEERDGTVEVFFYGLFMDESLLRAKGLSPEGRRAACVDNFRLVIGERNPLYASKLRELAARLGLPADYVSSIG